ncbi:MAG: hypothetical protein ABI114_02640 [Rhodanobacter sp.]
MLDINFNLERVYPRHDLLVEMGQVELAMDQAAANCHDGAAWSPDLEARMHDLLAALDRLDV